MSRVAKIPKKNSDSPEIHIFNGSMSWNKICMAEFLKSKLKKRL